MRRWCRDHALPTRLGAFSAGSTLTLAANPRAATSRRGRGKSSILSLPTRRFRRAGQVEPSSASPTDLAAAERFSRQDGRKFKNGGGEHPPGIEVYAEGDISLSPGKVDGPRQHELRRVPLADLRWLIREAGPKFAGKSRNGRDDSRSAKAWRVGAALKASGPSYEEMHDALLGHEDPDVADWARTKGLANGEREMRRIFDKTPCLAGVIDTRAPYDTARLFQSGLATPLRCHRGGFYEWDGCAWREEDEAALRARLYSFLDECQAKTGKGSLCPVKPNAQMVGSVLDALRAAAHLDTVISPPAWLDGVEGPEATRSSPVPTACCTCRLCGSCPTRLHFLLTTRSTLLTTPTRASRSNGSTSWTSSGQATPNRLPRCKRFSAIA